MAIDTTNKRRSALGMVVLPVPDGTIGDADRQHKVWKYAGIAAEAPAVSLSSVIRRAARSADTAVRRVASSDTSGLRWARSSDTDVIRRTSE